MSDCSKYIGMPFKLRSDGKTDGYIDCINLCYRCLETIGIDTPPFNVKWYDTNRWLISRDLLQWGKRITTPKHYDGDIFLFPSCQMAFGCAWNQGVLYINQLEQKVAWSVEERLPKYHCFRSRKLY